MSKLARLHLANMRPECDSQHIRFTGTPIHQPPEQGLLLTRVIDYNVQRTGPTKVCSYLFTRCRGENKGHIGLIHEQSGFPNPRRASHKHVSGRHAEASGLHLSTQQRKRCPGAFANI